MTAAGSYEKPPPCWAPPPLLDCPSRKCGKQFTSDLGLKIHLACMQAVDDWNHRNG